MATRGRCVLNTRLYTVQHDKAMTGVSWQQYLRSSIPTGHACNRPDSRVFSCHDNPSAGEYSYRTDINELLSQRIAVMFEFVCSQLCQVGGSQITFCLKQLLRKVITISLYLTDLRRTLNLQVTIMNHRIFILLIINDPQCLLNLLAKLARYDKDSIFSPIFTLVYIVSVCLPTSRSTSLVPAML